MTERFQYTIMWAVLLWFCFGVSYELWLFLDLLKPAIFITSVVSVVIGTIAYRVSKVFGDS